MNTFTLLGKLVRDPELLYGATTNKPYCKFTVAVDRKFAQNEKKADFFDLIAFDKKAQIIAQYFKKGSNILVTGNLQQNLFETKNGEKRSEVKLCVYDFEFIDKPQWKQDEPKQAEPKKEVSDEFMSIPKDVADGLPFM